MQLNVALPLGALLLLEVAIATAKSLREGNLAFLFPRLSSSETGIIARQLEHLIEIGDKKRIKEEFADCLAWLLSVASILGIDAEEAMTKYRRGCPKCHRSPCECKEESEGWG